MSAYFEKLRASARARSSLLCIGLDPDPERIAGGAAGAARFCADIVRRTSDLACCYKPNSAFWEQYGVDGWKALMEVRSIIPTDIPVLFDGKRGDVGNTMDAYARAVFEALGMDAATVSPYLGEDSIGAFTRFSDRGVYVLCRTSNPGAPDLQDLEVSGRPLHMRVAELAATWNRSGNVALVVGATFPRELAEIRQHSPLPFLVPGVGAQGGDLEAALRAGWNGDEASCLISASRSVLYAADPTRAARELRDQTRLVLSA